MNPVPKFEIGQKVWFTQDKEYEGYISAITILPNDVIEYTINVSRNFKEILNERYLNLEPFKEYLKNNNIEVIGDVFNHTTKDENRFLAIKLKINGKTTIVKYVDYMTRKILLGDKNEN